MLCAETQQQVTKLSMYTQMKKRGTMSRECRNR